MLYDYTSHLIRASVDALRSRDDTRVKSHVIRVQMPSNSAHLAHARVGLTTHKLLAPALSNVKQRLIIINHRALFKV